MEREEGIEFDEAIVVPEKDYYGKETDILRV